MCFLSYYEVKRGTFTIVYSLRTVHISNAFKCVILCPIINPTSSDLIYTHWKSILSGHMGGNDRPLYGLPPHAPEIPQTLSMIITLIRNESTMGGNILHIFGKFSLFKLADSLQNMSGRKKASTKETRWTCLSNKFVSVKPVQYRKLSICYCWGHCGHVLGIYFPF